MPRAFSLLIASYFVASLAHFGHNAQYIGFDPGMPAWLTPGKVWLFWFAVTGVGLAALLLRRLKLQAPSFVLLVSAVLLARRRVAATLVGGRT